MVDMVSPVRVVGPADGRRICSMSPCRAKAWVRFTLYGCNSSGATAAADASS